MRYYLEVFRDITLDPRWKNDFDLCQVCLSCHLGNRMIGPPCSALHWEHVQKIFEISVPVGTTQLYFDETFNKRGGGVGISSIPKSQLL